MGNPSRQGRIPYFLKNKRFWNRKPADILGKNKREQILINKTPNMNIVKAKVFSYNEDRNYKKDSRRPLFLDKKGEDGSTSQGRRPSLEKGSAA